jgi:hypothetical protein
MITSIHLFVAMAQRARSTSRVRGYDDQERSDRVSVYPSVLPYPAAAAVSSHSSPASAKSAGSPREPTLDALPAVHPSPKMASPSFSMAQVHVPSPPRPFDYTFGVPSQAQQSQLGPAVVTPVSAVAPDWSTLQSPSDPTHNLLYTSPGQDPNSLFFGANGNQAGATPNNMYYPFDETSALGMNVGLTGAVGALPNPSFAGPGLPFTGLDFIRNYTTDGLSGTSDDSLWQSIDPRSFQFENDVPWSLADLPPIDEQTVQQ